MAIEKYFTYPGEKNTWKPTDSAGATLGYFTATQVMARRIDPDDPTLGLARLKSAKDEFDILGGEWVHGDFTPVDTADINGKASWDLWEANNEIERCNELIAALGSSISIATAKKVSSEMRRDAALTKKTNAEKIITELRG